MAITGKPVDRIDGRAKVTGAAKYAADFNQPRMAYAFPVRSTVASGTVTRVDTRDAERAGGVVVVLTHENAPRLRAVDPQEMRKSGGSLGEILVPLQDTRVSYYGQFVALVVAETYEQARAAAALVKVTYAATQAKSDLRAELPNATRPERTAQGKEAQLNAGKAAALISAAPHKVEQTYTTSTEVHNPMEPHACVAIWSGEDRLTIHDATQGVVSERGTMAYLFDLPRENVRILSPFLGGGFGGKGSPWTHNLLAAMAARVVKRPVKLAVTRQMMQTSVGRRSATIQEIGLGAQPDGTLVAIRHHSDVYKGLAPFFEASGVQAEVLYKAPLREITYRVAQLNVGTPTYMRAPGYAPGSFALESAMDELAHELKMDPIELRVRNHTKDDPLKKLPYSSEYLVECYRVGAERFGWTRRKAAPRQTRDGRHLVGMGMATATYHGNRSSATARVRMAADGTVTVMSATQDIGTGTYTIVAQTAADALGVPIETITVELGDSDLPPAPLSAGSQTAASVTPAVMAACEALRRDLSKLATGDADSRLHGASVDDIGFAGASLFARGDASRADAFTDIMRRNGKTTMEACATAMPASGSGLGAPGAPCAPAEVPPDSNSDSQKYSFHSFGAQFAEVWVDEDLGTIRVKRFTTVLDVGRILNEKTARSQAIGGVVFGIGAALMEGTDHDRRWANPIQRSLADYHVPVHADVPAIDVYFIDKADPHISAIGARGVGEIGTVGVSAAIANAVFNATGKRIRDLPITPDKLM